MNETVNDDKLVPELDVSADDQIVVAGLVVFLLLAALFGWTFLTGDDEPIAADIPVTEVEQDEVDAEQEENPEPAPVVNAVDEDPVDNQPKTNDAPLNPTDADVQAAVNPLPGDITGTTNDSRAVLTGFVANQAESDAAEEAAEGVTGIESVENRLELLEPKALDALEDANVKNATATGSGTTVTVSGVIDNEDARKPTLDAVEAIEGVGEVIDDELTVSVAEDLNALPKVQFAYNSATILAESFADLDEAASLIQGSGGVQLEIQGYTDVTGNEADNLELSQTRTESVRDYLIEAGVEADQLEAVGYGETEEFAAGNNEEALAANRVVRFEELDS